MKINNLPKKYEKIWGKCQSLLRKGRVGDLEHAADVVGLILNYKGKIKIDKDILIPVAMMHDIGHSAILPEHFRFITGEDKISNGKLVHMLAGAKIAQDILSSVQYPKNKSNEIVEIISVHDADQLTGINVKEIYNTTNRKFFHDIDSLDRYNEERMRKFLKYFKDKNKLTKLLEENLKSFFYPEFRDLAKSIFKNFKI